MAKELELQPVETDAEGRPLLGYIIPKDQFEAFQQELTRILNGQPVMIGSKDDGDQIRIKIWGLSLQAATAVSEALSDRFNVQRLARSEAEPNLLSFDLSLKKPQD